MMPVSLAFGDFVLDPAQRRLWRSGEPVELNSRYFDALALLAREPGILISKDRFMAEVWRGVPVTDEALTQCVRALRRQLGDDAARPRFIETVPKHGYRFIAPVRAQGEAPAPASVAGPGLRRLLLLGGAGTLGGGVAGAIGGLLYGFAVASGQAGAGGLSALLVVLWVTILVALVGGAGVAFGIAGAAVATGRGWRWSVAGGAIGGLVIGGGVKLLGLDAFNLLLGQSPGNVTGGAEGAALGGAVGLAGWLAARFGGSLRRRLAIAALTGAAAGALIPLSGGRLFGGSLDLLAHRMPGARLRLDSLGALFGEAGFGPIAQCVTGALEGALFAASIVGALILAERRLDRP